MAIRDRIKSLRRVRAGDLVPDPRNWRRHPDAQRTAMNDVLDRIGYADAIVARETDAGLMIVDGHLRADLDPDQKVPVLIVDLDDDEAAIALATHDPLAYLSDPDVDQLESLLTAVDENLDSAIIEEVRDWAGIATTETNPDMDSHHRDFDETDYHEGGDAIATPRGPAEDFAMWVLYIPKDEYDETIERARRLCEELDRPEQAGAMVVEALKVLERSRDES